MRNGNGNRGLQNTDEAKLRLAVLETARGCIISFDRAGCVVEWNPTAEKTFGYARDIAIGQPMSELIAPQSSREALAEDLQRYVNAGADGVVGKRLEITGKRADGAEFPIELTTTLDHLDGETIFTSYVRDISDRCEAERQLAEARDKAVEASRLKSQFLATTSHELLELMGGEIQIESQAGSGTTVSCAIPLGAVDVVEPENTVAVTANAMKGDREACMEAGMDDYVPKPVDPALLAQAIERNRPRAGAQAPPTAAGDSFEQGQTPMNAILNLTVLENLRAYQREGQPDIVTRLIDLFLGQAPSHIAAIATAHSAGDGEALARAAHALKGASANLGAIMLTELAAEIELLGRGGDIAKAAAVVAALQAEYALVDTDLTAQRQPLPSQTEPG